MDVIFDIDRTLANIDHRVHHLFVNPKNWIEFRAGAPHDTVIEPIANVCRAMHRAHHRIILCSARSEEERPVTEGWLSQNRIPYDALYLRPAGDYRHDDVIKAELLTRMRIDGFYPVLAFEDRTRVVQQWRRLGLMCAQVAEGDF